MSEIYIVTSGEYSDYHIERVFQSKEKAEKYVQARGNVPEIEIYELSDDKINQIIVPGKFIRGIIGKLSEVWLDYDCEREDYYITMGECDEYCTVNEVHTSKGIGYQLNMGKFIPQDQWREQESMDKFAKILTDKMAEVKSMLADGMTVDMINEVLKEDL